MDKFDVSYRFVAKWEGGFDDDPVDRGGVTNFGVSIEFLKDCQMVDSYQLRALGIITPVCRDSIVKLTQAQAKALFKWRFWDALHLDDYPTPLSVVLCDCAVNHGRSRAVKLAQKGYNAINPSIYSLAVDGILGPLTSKALRDCAESSLQPLCEAIIAERRAFYRAIVDSNPSQKRFLRGWMNRVADLETYIRGAK